MKNNDIMTIKEVARYLKLNLKTAYRLASIGAIPSFKIGGSVRCSKQEIINWLEQQRTKGV